MMGHGMAKNLLAKGFPLTFRRTATAPTWRTCWPPAPPRPSTQRRDCAARRDIVFICVTGSPQVEEIVYGADGLLGAARTA